MIFLDQFRNSTRIKETLSAIHKVTTKQWSIMEICGGQTHAIMQYGLHQLLPTKIELIHGPGCPVCVTPLETIDQALFISSQKDVIFTSFGDMLRVPGSKKNLLTIRAEGGDVRVVYSPVEAIRLAQQNPEKEVVFFAIGFETTAPANAMSVIRAHQLGVKNYSMLVSQVRVPPAIMAILNTPNNRVNGILAAGHVCAVMGYNEYLPITKKYHVPFAVTGFEPLDLLLGIYETIKLLEEDRDGVINAYSRAVNKEGNPAALKIINEVYEPIDQKWRGIGMIPESGLTLNRKYSSFNATRRFNIDAIKTEESKICISGSILQGLKIPPQCPAFGTICTPENPLGATMVSSEGTCSAYYRYGK